MKSICFKHKDYEGNKMFMDTDGKRLQSCGCKVSVWPTWKPLKWWEEREYNDQSTLTISWDNPERESLVIDIINKRFFGCGSLAKDTIDLVKSLKDGDQIVHNERTWESYVKPAWMFAR